MPVPGIGFTSPPKQATSHKLQNLIALIGLLNNPSKADIELAIKKFKSTENFTKVTGSEDLVGLFEE